jgi:hypothetical protein
MLIQAGTSMLFSALSQFAVSGTQRFLRRKNKPSLESGDKRFGGELPSS